MSQLFAWDGQSTGASALASFLPKKSQVYTPTINAKEVEVEQFYKTYKTFYNWHQKNPKNKKQKTKQKTKKNTLFIIGD